MCICGTFLSGIDWDIRLWSEAGWNIVVTLLGINIKDFGSFRAMIVTNHCGISPTVYKKKAFQRKRHLICCNIYDYCSCSTLCLVGKWVRSLFDVVYLFTSRPRNVMLVFKKYDRQNHVWSFMTKYLRFLCKFNKVNNMKYWHPHLPFGQHISVSTLVYRVK
jgi:hypothetical protein